MATNAIKPAVQALDNFDGFDSSVEGDERQGGGLLRGIRLKFTETAAWVTIRGEDFGGKVLLATNVRRMELKWINDRPSSESRELQAGEKFRDLEALNEACPRSEWREAFGKMVGPWTRQYILEFADLKSMDQFSWPTSTIGGGIAVRELVDRINMKRKFEGRNDLWPFVRLSHVFMQTAFKGRERPDLKIESWYSPDSETVLAAGPQRPQLSNSAFEPVPDKPVSLQEEMKDDAVPY